MARALHARGTGIIALISSFFLLFKIVFCGVKKLFTSHRNWTGGIAHMVERVLCIYEVPGLIPGSSIFFSFSRLY